MKGKLLIYLLAAGLACSAQPNQLKTIHFEYNKYDLTTDGKGIIDSFLKIVPPASITEIKLYGHCDSIGNNNYNDKLSLNRVATVRKYLQDNQIPAVIFKEEKGLGKRQPLNTNTTAEERFLNRRVEIYISYTIEKPKPEVIPDIVPPISKIEKSLQQNINDTSTKTGTTIILKNMNFIGGRHVLLPQSVPVLLELLEALKQNPNLEIEIDGHICCIYGAEDGIDLDTGTPNLSVNRARAIYEYLLGHGIRKKRLSYKGFGHSMPLVYPEETEEKKTTNRRVEIKIVRK